MKIQEILKQSEGKTLEFKRDISSPKPILKTLDIEKIQRVLSVTGQQIDEKKLESLGLLVPHAGGLSVSKGKSHAKALRGKED